MKRFVAVAVAAAAVLVPAAQAAGTLDQSQTLLETSEPTAVGWLGQTFTAGITGKLDQVDLALYRAADPGLLVVQIWSVPSNAVLAAAIVESSAVTPASPGWVSVPFASPADSVARTQYAIVISSPGSNPYDVFYGWLASIHDVYPGGVETAEPLGSLDPARGDRAFRTYVTPSLPSTVADCKDGGWRAFAQFGNQGDCVSFLVSRSGRSG